MLLVIIYLNVPESLWTRVFLININITGIYGYSLRTFIRLKAKEKGGTVLIYGLCVASVSHLALAIYPLLFVSQDGYASLALVSGIITVVIMLGAVYSFFLEDLIRFHYENSIFDPLTKLFNRRHMLAELDRLAADASRNHFPISFIMCDIDHFKSVNDSYGHSAGDKVLQSFAAMLQGEIRKSDVVARYGGEEFLIILSHVDCRQTREIAEKLREKTSALSVIYGKDTIPITASFGVSEFDSTQTIEATIKRADKALYLAKEKGRNRVCIDKSFSLK